MNGWNDRTNMTMLTDFYELTMGKGYLDDGKAEKIVYFDVFFRNIPELKMNKYRAIHCAL